MFTMSLSNLSLSLKFPQLKLSPCLKKNLNQKSHQLKRNLFQSRSQKNLLKRPPQRNLSNQFLKYRKVPNRGP